MYFNETDKIIVTGASSGIGKALALKLNEQGATVIAIARSEDRLKELKNNSKYKESIILETKDLIQQVEELPNYIKCLREKYGKFKGLACVAGIDKVVTTQMLNKKDIDDVFLINYTVPMLLTKGFLNKKNNIGEGASILFIASIAGKYPDVGQILYGASKAALINASISISKEVAPRKIRCNCISPAWIDTPMFQNQKETIGIPINRYPLGIGQPEDVAELSTFLLSNKSSWITGENYTLTGGSY